MCYTFHEVIVMQHLIEQLYYGNVRPNENLKPAGAAYRANQDLACQLEETLRAELTPEQKSVYDAITEKRLATTCDEVAQAFVDGFKLAAGLMLEVLDDRQLQ